MVTDSVAYIGTSNWLANYFTGTAGIDYVINETCTSAVTSSVWEKLGLKFYYIC